MATASHQAPNQINCRYCTAAPVQFPRHALSTSCLLQDGIKRSTSLSKKQKIWSFMRQFLFLAYDYTYLLTWLIVLLHEKKNLFFHRYYNQKSYFMRYKHLTWMLNFFSVCEVEKYVVSLENLPMPVMRSDLHGQMVYSNAPFKVSNMAIKIFTCLSHGVCFSIKNHQILVSTRVRLSHF